MNTKLINGNVWYDIEGNMFSSFCTGWTPNQCKYSISEGIEKQWSILTKIGDESTFRTQPAFFLTIKGTEGISYIYVSDRWNGKDYNDSRYVFLPVTFDEKDLPVMNYCDSFSVNVVTGRLYCF